ncbi:tyrosine-type recombinase/integrase [Aerosakkonemataceae cyanobacterium BLCC-F50]|uniref:Tyrosine-type recombinase/integrase n=1 Tax=Floridaenema flaviceps BLCC-F50 TaxID=3153642 RepID=A0ABV4XTB0_9CYAN
MPKIDRHGKAAILNAQQITKLFEAFGSDRDRALFGCCLYLGCRISEACSLQTIDVYSPGGEVRSQIQIRRAATKGKQETRTLDTHPQLLQLLEAHRPGKTWVFQSRSHHWKHIDADSADWILREACRKAGLEGVSTHSFRRTALTAMSNAGVPLRVIQEVSGHHSLNELQKYLEVSEEQRRSAIATLNFHHFGIDTFSDIAAGSIATASVFMGDS